jgi:AcrR family transcriptional regulator
MTVTDLAETAFFERHDPAKRRQILDGAREVFLRDGFDGASVNDIARVAGVSKGTIYVYFDSKEHLFETLIREDRRAQAERICTFDSENHDVRAVLRTFGRSLLETMMRPENMAHLRTVIAAAAKFPSLGRAFYEAGPEHGIAKLAAYLDRQVVAGILAMADTRRAAMQFIELCQAGLMKPMLFCVIDETPLSAIATAVDAAVAVFMAAYGTAAGNPPAPLPIA